MIETVFGVKSSKLYIAISKCEYSVFYRTTISGPKGVDQPIEDHQLTVGITYKQAGINMLNMLSETPTRDEVLEYFYSTSWREWMYHNVNTSYAGHDPEDPTHNPVYVCNNDVRLRIERGKIAVRDFQEDWIEDYPDTDASSYSYWLYLNDSPIAERVLVAVDGHKAYLPVPDIHGDQRTIDQKGEHWGRIVTREDSDFRRSCEYADIVVES